VGRWGQDPDRPPACYVCTRDGIFDRNGHVRRAAVRAGICREPYVLCLCLPHLAQLQQILPKGGVRVVRQYQAAGPERHASSMRYQDHPGLGMSILIGPAAWLARDFGTDPATGLDGVTAAILGRARLPADGDAAAVRAVLDLATRGSAWHALQLQDPVDITTLAAMQDAAAALHPATAPDILVSAVLDQVCLVMFPGRRPAAGSPPAVAMGTYLSRWWQAHVRRR
jgi:hypothetical protein